METLKELVTRRLKDLSLNQTDLAKAIGVTPAQVSRILSGERGSTSEVFNALADFIRVPRLRVYEALGWANGKDVSQDPWLDEQTYRLEKLTGSRRAMADRLLKGLEAEEMDAADQEESANRKLKPAER
jgi:transcriptional regulator with XRE-family HTH domain